MFHTITVLKEGLSNSKHHHQCPDFEVLARVKGEIGRSSKDSTLEIVLIGIGPQFGAVQWEVRGNQFEQKREIRLPSPLSVGTV